jgi:acyl transferase domain-containing protein
VKVSRPRRTAVVVCPGRGTYNKAELGYLGRHGQASMIAAMDAWRAGHGRPTLSELDGADRFDVETMTRGDNASPLIFACSLGDFLALDPAAVEVVAVTGNSMGWYTALACGGALSHADALAVVDAMGGYMHEALIGGQVVHTLVDDDWRPIPGRREALMDLIGALHGAEGRELYVSIELGGMIVLAGNAAGLDALLAKAPRGPGVFPLTLQNHAAFHTPLQAPISARARASLDKAWFHSPRIPMIDGRGFIWRPAAAEPADLWDYTFGHQVVAPYDFTTAIAVSVREFAPDCLIILGPGTTLGGAVAQCLIAARWRGLDSKAAFVRLQDEAPFVIAMGREDQRALVAAQ